MSVTPPRTSDKLSIASAFLKRSAPRSWEEFAQAIDTLTAEAAVACVQSSPDQVLRLQGRAQQLAELSSLFKTCIADADTLEQKLKERQNGR